MVYEILDVDALGRIGKLSINNKEMITPNLFPVVHPVNNVVSTTEIKKIGAECIFTNAYIIYQNESIKKKVLKKGLHQYLNFDGLIATDSGAFQQYMYRKDKISIKAEEIERFQENIRSDFPVILDIPVQIDDAYSIAKKKVAKTIERAKENIKRRTNENCHWFGPIHGGKYKDLLEYSATEMNKLDFEVYAIGGLVKAFLDYRFELTLDILIIAKKRLMPNRPIHMFGLGLPQFFSLAVACGCDLMDSAAYVLYAKENRYFTLSTGTKKLEELKEFPCHCPICSDFTPKEIKSSDEKLKVELLAKHNLFLSFSELRTIRQAIREGKLWELVESRIRSHPNLVKAANKIKNHKDYFEVNEKSFKKHGSLFASNESINRPMIYRYEKKLKTNYRPPKEVKYLIILPELDVKFENSPTIKKWLKKIDNNTIIQRKFLHVTFFSEFFGIIPLELDMFQYESIPSMGVKDLLYRNSIQKLETFLGLFFKHYKKFGALIPQKYINQFHEITEFPKSNPIYGLNSIFISKFNLNFSIFNNIEDLLQFFRDDNNIDNFGKN
ncbi:MAG: tRNA guanosine(15) transglycosylase TgtA [Promethearchaeota archaeon]